MLSIKGQLAFTKPYLLGQFIFHQEPVLEHILLNQRLIYNRI